MTFIPNGSELTWVGAWIPGTFETAQGSGAKVSTRLTRLGLNVVSLTLEFPPGFVHLGGEPVTYTITVRTADGTGHASEDDVAAIIAHAVYEATGSLPESGKITNISLPTFGGTGPSVTQPAPPCGTGLLEGLKGLLGICSKPIQQKQAPTGGLFSGLSSTVTWYVALAVFGFVAALALIGYSGSLRRQV